MSLFRMDPGPCPVDDAPHTTCTATAPMETVMLPNRDAAVAARRAAAVSTTPPPSAPPLKEGEFTTATYRRAVHGKDRKR